MPRKNRSFQAGAIYHLIPRFVANEWFIRGPLARIHYLKLLGEGLANTDWRCLGFAVMSNHIHLAVLAGKARLATWIADPHSQFAEYVNQTHHRIGAVFTRGPKSVPYSEKGLAALLSYIHRNPVRAGVVEHPGQTDWTSHLMYAGKITPPPWLDVQRALAITGLGQGSELAAWIDGNVVDRERLAVFRRQRRRRGRQSLCDGVADYDPGFGGEYELPAI